MSRSVEKPCNESRRRKRSRGTLMVCSINVLLQGSFQVDLASAFLQHQPWRTFARGKLNPHTSRANVAVTISSTDDLEVKLGSMTVKELRDIVKSSKLNHRGVLSRLKLKKELVDFLKDNLGSSSLDDSFSNVTDETTFGTRINHVETKSTPAKPLAMPKLNGSLQLSNSTLSAKEATFEKTYMQYPPLRDEDCTGIGEDDIRQLYHPIFSGEHTQLTGDMDIVFVGTASCTPGVSRGVSCTALRLNWNRQAIHGIPGASESQVKGFNGGTWIFDCGECTQVSLRDPHVAVVPICK